MLEKAFQNINAAVLLIDSEHRIQWMNNKAVEWFGIKEIGLRRVCYKTMSLSLAFCATCPTNHALECGISTTYDFTLPSKNRLKHFEVLAIPIHNEDGNDSVLELVIDRDERGAIKAGKNELMAQIERLAAVGHLAADIAHELNTPLGTISMICEELTRAVEKQGDEYPIKEISKEYLADMGAEIKRCRTIIDDLLSFSKSNVSNLEKININEFIEKTLAFLGKWSAVGEVEIARIFMPNPPPIVTDGSKLRQALFNIIKNAIEVTEGRPDSAVQIVTAMNGKGVTITVKDNGPGMPPDIQERAFEPFFTTKPVGKGTGLGLSVSYGIMKCLGGDIAIKSGNEGTTVTLSLPLTMPEQEYAHEI